MVVSRQVSDAERSMVKQIVYGLCYGMGSGRMAAALSIPEVKARELSDDFKRSHPALTAWTQVGWLCWLFGPTGGTASGGLRTPLLRRVDTRAHGMCSFFKVSCNDFDRSLR